ncbi:MAG: efflux RND transporter periplasmic adaptor subunit [Nitrospira sp.]|nr:efflux RND transporter periplasmic adaptor subunit [Nitrospira sp.]MCP9442152.1 efflux RND transporter periplasmic adaptor subunit [Nitrospira sp.]
MGERRGWKTNAYNKVSVWLSALLLLTACGRSDQSCDLTKENPPEGDKRTASVTSSPLVETAVVEWGASHQKLTLFGKVAYGEDRYSRISSPLQGRVIEVRAHLGDRVKAGDILLVVDSPDIAQAYSEYVKEDSELEYATRAYELAKDLYEAKALALKDLKQAENELVKAQAEFRRAKERLLSLRITPEELDKPLDKQTITSRFELKSPLTGVVVERAVTPGQLVMGEVLFTIADLDQLQVLADLYERDVALVKEGQSAVVKVEAYPDIDFPARITAVGDIVDSSTRTIKVRALVNNKARLLKPEMFARLQLDLSEAGRFLILPQKAILEKDGKQFVYVVENSGRYVKREVKVVNTSSDQVRVLEGVRHGERVVVKGAVLIKE